MRLPCHVAVVQGSVMPADGNPKGLWTTAVDCLIKPARHKSCWPHTLSCRQCSEQCMHFEQHEASAHSPLSFCATFLPVQQVGPIVAPFLGAFLGYRFGWRSTLWFLAMQAGLTQLVTASLYRYVCSDNAYTVYVKIEHVQM